MTLDQVEHCPLCETQGGDLVWQDAFLRVVLPAEPEYPGFVRVIWNHHRREMTDLSPAERTHFMNVVWSVESIIREIMEPDKINLASLGNVVPHLHWHIIPRYTDDRHFPAPIWATPQRETCAITSRQHQQRAAWLSETLATRLSTEFKI
jgi:diadenosine tetraphosphate (Ap4A) HIT family hydrolase